MTLKESEMKNPYPYNTLNNTLHWAFYETSRPLAWVVKYTARKHNLTQTQVKECLKILFTGDERIERGNRIIKELNLKVPIRKTSTVLNAKLNKEYSDIMRDR